jgi:hypothetical protein
VHRPQKLRMPGIVLDRTTNLRDQREQIGFGHKHTGPKRVLQLSLREDARTRENQQPEQLERFRRQVNDCAVAMQLAGFVIERPPAE